MQGFQRLEALRLRPRFLGAVSRAGFHSGEIALRQCVAGVAPQRLAQRCRGFVVPAETGQCHALPDPGIDVIGIKR